MDIVDCLMKVGFTKHEATLYITLCREGGLTGYEASKLSGIPRSNTYLALAGLVDKGGALRIEGASVKYSAVPASELIFNLRRRQEEAFEFIERNTPSREEAIEPYYTITGAKNIISKMCHIISQAKERIYISTSPGELGFVKKELTHACGRGLKVVIITSDGFDIRGATIYRNEKQPGQIRLIADSSEVLTGVLRPSADIKASDVSTVTGEFRASDISTVSGEFRASADSTALYSHNRNLIDLIKDSLKNEITLINIKAGAANN